MKLQNLTVIFIIIIIPIILLVSLYITTGLKTLKYQSLYDTGLLTATHDAIFAFEQNTSNDKYSNNPEKKRDILKSSIKMFEKSLANTCGISSYNLEEIEEYIPAIVFGMYDGFYMYAPSKECVGEDKYEYKHNLKNYVYYSETLDDGTVIRYTLDNYVVVTGFLKDEDDVEKYLTKGGYLANFYTGDIVDVAGKKTAKKYQGTDIAVETLLTADKSKDGIDHSKDGINYYQEAYEFTNWFLKKAQIQNKKKNGETASYLDIKDGNDPENESSAFAEHKRNIMKSKIEGVLNSSITAYSQRTWDKVYKMPKLSVEDWEKIYSNISMITFFQGKNIGLTKYNGYCVLNSTNSKEYVNPNLMYFIENNYYHDIRCAKLEAATQVTGYRIGSFQKRKIDVEIPKKDDDGYIMTNEDGTVQTETVGRYIYDITDLACYDCINGPLQSNVSLYDYVRRTAANNRDKMIKTSYFTSLGRERYNGLKTITYIPTQNEIEIADKEFLVQFKPNAPEGEVSNMPEDKTVKKGNTFSVTTPQRTGYNFKGWHTESDAREPIPGPIIVNSNMTLYVIWEPKAKYNIEFKANAPEAEVSNMPETIPVEEGNIVPIRVEDPVRTGYNFKGWHTISDAREPMEEPIELTVNGNIDLYAIWEPKEKYNINFVANALEDEVSNMPETITAEEGDIVSISGGAPIRSGYDFIGWHTESDAREPMEEPIEFTVNGNIDLYAIWEPKETIKIIYRYKKNTEHKTLEETYEITNDGYTLKDLDGVYNCIYTWKFNGEYYLPGETLENSKFSGMTEVTFEAEYIALDILFRKCEDDGRFTVTVEKPGYSTTYTNVSKVGILLEYRYHLDGTIVSDITNINYSINSINSTYNKDDLVDKENRTKNNEGTYVVRINEITYKNKTLRKSNGDPLYAETLIIDRTKPQLVSYNFDEKMSTIYNIFTGKWVIVGTGSVTVSVQATDNIGINKIEVYYESTINGIRESRPYELNKKVWSSGSTLPIYKSEQYEYLKSYITGICITDMAGNYYYMEL